MNYLSILYLTSLSMTLSLIFNRHGHLRVLKIWYHEDTVCFEEMFIYHILWLLILPIECFEFQQLCTDDLLKYSNYITETSTENKTLWTKMIFYFVLNKDNNKITELRTILQRESQNS